MGNSPQSDDRSPSISQSRHAQKAVEFSRQAEKLSLNHPGGESPPVAVEAHFVTPHDPVIKTSDGQRLPGVPIQEAHKLNALREELQDEPGKVEVKEEIKEGDELRERSSSNANGSQGDRKVVSVPRHHNGLDMQKSGGGTLKGSMPPSHTNPLFPPLPLYGPPSLLRNIQCILFRVSSFFLSLAFLGVIVLGALFKSIPTVFRRIYYTLTFRDIDQTRPFYEEELRRANLRRRMEKAWQQNQSTDRLEYDREAAAGDFHPTAGGRDPLVCDVGYYARRVGLDVEEFKVQTEDGFIIDLWHVYDPKEYTQLDSDSRDFHGPDVFQKSGKRLTDPKGKRKFPVLLMHGLLQSSGAYCTNDDDSLAFWLCKSGYDVWLGNNRCGFEPKHTVLKYSDPRMWSFNIRQMGVFDLPALTSRILHETGFEKLGLVCHSQGTTQTFVALAKEQRPDLGDKLTVVCALAPAAYAGPLIGKMYFRFMRIISPSMFRLMFGIHAFIPFMMLMHKVLHPRIYGYLGYKVFSFLFDWTDARWDRGLRDRMFQFAPVYVSAESMRWWLGRECFAKHKCILSTKEVTTAEEQHDEIVAQDGADGDSEQVPEHLRKHRTGATAWYDEKCPPFALWVCGSDKLVDGRRLVRRFESRREPHVRVVHSKVIPEYEHLDVLWAMDAVDQVYKEVREVLWKTCDARDACRVPVGCEHVEPWKEDEVASGDSRGEQSRSSSSSSSSNSSDAGV